MKAIGKLKCPERSFSYSGPGVKTLSAVSWMCKATPGAGVTRVLGFLSWQRVVEKQRTVLDIQEIFVVDCVFYLMQGRY